MKRLLLYIKLLLLSWFSKGKSLWQRIWSFYQTEDAFEESIPDSIYIGADKYNPLFEDEAVISNFLVSEQIWDKIYYSLPLGYLLPNGSSKDTLNTMRADSFDGLFSKPISTPSLFVDINIWNKISHTVSQVYKLPNPAFDSVIKPMKGSYYEHLFSQQAEEADKQTFVDNLIWEPIKKHLPKTYILPNPSSEIIFNAINGNTFHPLDLRESPLKELSNKEIESKILNSLPKNYKIPHLDSEK